MENYLVTFLMISITYVTVGCVKQDKEKALQDEIVSYYFPRSEWDEFIEKKIFFGHQSVGMEIIDGVKKIQSFNRFPYINILETIETSDYQTPVFGHTRVGRILYPKSKIDDFVSVLENGIGERADAAFMKIGFPDINKKTDVHELFSYYENSMKELQIKFPHLRIIHCTVSLTTKPQGLKGLTKVILRMDNNLYRNNFNDLMRKHYNQGNLFDIAAIQSKRANGDVNIYRNNIPGMIPEYTTDGGHLSELGRLVLAKELIKLIVSTN
jgi:hypothetical protein